MHQVPCPARGICSDMLAQPGAYAVTYIPWQVHDHNKKAIKRHKQIHSNCKAINQENCSMKLLSVCRVAPFCCNVICLLSQQVKLLMNHLRKLCI